MSFYYFVNCILLTFLPLSLVYKLTNLSEFGSIYRCSSAVIAYIATQILKLILIATLSIKSTILDHIIDCIGLHYVLINQHKASPAQVKILGVAIGWNFAESLLTRFIDFYVNAKSMQFDFKHIHTAIEANISLLETICLCTLIWTWSRGSLKVESILLAAYILAHSFLVDFTIRLGLLSILAISTFVLVS